MRWGHGLRARRSLAVCAAVGLVGLTVAGQGTTSASAAARPAVGRTAEVASGDAVISGRLVAPGPSSDVGGVTVTLTGTPTSGDAITRTAVTGPDGAFTFRGLAGGDWSYTMTAPYQGATFSSDPVTVPAGQGLTVTLPVFSSTESPAKVRISSWIVWLDVTADKVTVEQDLSYTNSGTAAYTGTVPVSGASSGARAAVLLPVAPGAGGFQYLGRFEVCCSAVQDTSWAHTRPINPGGSSGTLRYEATRPADLALVAQFAADSVTVLVPQGTAVSSPQLTGGGTTTDQGRTYQVYKSAALKAGDTLTLSFPGGSAADAGGSAGWLTALGVVVLVSLGAAYALVLRRRRRPVAPAPTLVPKGATVTKARTGPRSSGAAKPAPLAKPVPPARAGSPAPSGGRNRADVLTEELAELDLRFENGELTDEAAYRRVRESLVQRLVETVESDQTSRA